LLKVAFNTIILTPSYILLKSENILLNLEEPAK